MSAVPSETLDMLKSLVVAFDETPASVTAAGIAFDLAKRHGAKIAGVCVFDAAALTPAEPVPAGAMAFKKLADRGRVRQGAELWDQARAHFLAEMAAAGLEAPVTMATGDADATLSATAAAHDLLVIGRDAEFGLVPSARFSKLVRALIEHNPRPLIVGGERARKDGPILVAYDASVPAARTLQAFTLLGLGQGREVHVLAVGTSFEQAGERLAPALAYLGSHGIATVPHPVATGGDPPTIILDLARELDPAMLVMGVFGHRGWREALLGSTTTRMLDAAPVPLFIHH